MPESTWLSTSHALPTYAVLMAEGFTPVSGSIALSALSTQHYGYAAIQSNDGDEIEYVFPLGAGMYEMRLLARTGATHGITDVYLDGVEIHSADLYSASTTNNVLLTQSGVVVSSGGLHTIRMKTDGKNASSTGYVRHVSSVRFTPE